MFQLLNCIWKWGKGEITAAETESIRNYFGGLYSDKG